MSTPEISAVVFDIGGVLVDWNPEHLYGALIPDSTERAVFLGEVCTPSWNHTLDAGGSVRDSVAVLAGRHPEWAHLIHAWWERWHEMLSAEIPGTRAVAEALVRSGLPVYALTNWAAETWPRGIEAFPFLGEIFAGVVVSGHESVAKPDRRLFEIMNERFDLEPATTVFIDDTAANIETASDLGYLTHHFESADILEAWLRDLGLPALIEPRS
ncbi:MAG: HAD family phosphatase [bacterium]|nr:HAD family phosphatase [bacterium]